MYYFFPELTLIATSIESGHQTQAKCTPKQLSDIGLYASIRGVAAAVRHSQEVTVQSQKRRPHINLRNKTEKKTLEKKNKKQQQMNTEDPSCYQKRSWKKKLPLRKHGL